MRICKTPLKKGFTLLELALIVAIAVILTLVAIPLYKNLEKASHLAVEKEVVANINVGLSWYYIKHLAYPESLDDAAIGLGTKDSDFFNRVLIASDKISASWNKQSSAEYTNVWSDNQYCYDSVKGIFNICGAEPLPEQALDFDLPDEQYEDLAAVQENFPDLQYAEYSTLGGDRLHNLALDNGNLIIGDSERNSVEKLWLQSSSATGDYSDGTYQFNDFTFLSDGTVGLFFHLRNGDLTAEESGKNPLSGDVNDRDGVTGYALEASTDSTQGWIIEKYYQYGPPDYDGARRTIGTVIPSDDPAFSDFFATDRPYDIEITTTQIEIDGSTAENIVVSVIDLESGEKIEKTFNDTSHPYTSGTVGYVSTVPQNWQEASQSTVKVGFSSIVPPETGV